MLEVRALGGTEAFHSGTPIRFQTQKGPEILVFLLLQGGRPVDRSIVAESLWPARPPGSARRCLSTELWRLRKAIRSADPSSASYIHAGRQSVSFDISRAHRFDVAQFERGIAQGLRDELPLAEEAIDRLEAAIRLYKGALLEGTYNDWCLADRERLQLLLIRALKRVLVHRRVTGAVDAAIAAGRRLLAIDPLQEDIHRELMRCFAASGRRAQALDQYERCRRVLKSELRIEPMAETRALHLRIRGEAPFTLAGTGVHENRAQYEAALDRFREALDALEASWAALSIESPGSSIL
jgi:DNA-binding SARP family transcriptional activator